ncbi:MAG: bifunctional demethylmenaquinone methyltransferase/2-methoxy-6-polyprenyl-1,4-benzoquinol methylase UbiE [Trueperaceae bacterium]|nr:bifunctional demethylmenaquinone methyltransferase/2-methoxy-6-polyprenyl-1,4-benzoquinol methylase UbiE [Trueperaceae bacterium]
MSLPLPNDSAETERDPSAEPSATSDTSKHDPNQSAKAVQVRTMFNAIARRYDLLNAVLSAGVDRRWRAEATRLAFEKGATRVLDVATGTADLAISLKRYRPEAEVIGVDFAEGMLELGRRKVARKGLSVRLEQGDGLNLPYPDASFDALTIAYGLRNFADYQRGLDEFYRVLKPGGRLVVLEFPPPPEGLFGRLFRFYFLRVVPLLGGLLSGRRSAYRYLPDSVLRFPPPPKLAVMMQRAGFDEVRYKLQTFGVSALHVGDKRA